jgi:hypothetical protein
MDQIAALEWGVARASAPAHLPAVAPGQASGGSNARLPLRGRRHRATKETT